MSRLCTYIGIDDLQLVLTICYSAGPAVNTSLFHFSKHNGSDILAQLIGYLLNWGLYGALSIQVCPSPSLSTPLIPS